MIIQSEAELGSGRVKDYNGLKEVTQHMEKEWLTVREFVARHKGRIGRNTAYLRIADGTIPSIRLGKKLLVPGDALDRMLERD